MTDTIQTIESENLPFANGEIWVTDPKTNQRVDVKSFLKALNDFEPGYDSALNQGALDSIKRTMRFLTLIVHDPTTTDFLLLSNVFNDLWRLWDMFEETSAIQPKRQ